MMFHPSGAVFKSKPKKLIDEESNNSIIIDSNSTGENKNEDEEIKKLALELKTRQITNLILKSTLIEKVSNSQQNDQPNSSNCNSGSISSSSSSSNDLTKTPIANSTPILHGLLKMQDTSLYTSSIFLKLNNCNNNNDNESSSNSPRLESPATLELNDRILKTFNGNNNTNNNQSCEDRNERSLSSSSASSLSSLSPLSTRQQSSSIATTYGSPKTSIATTSTTTTTTTPVIYSSNNSNSGYYSPVLNTTVINPNDKSQEHDESKCLNETLQSPHTEDILNENIDANSNASVSSSSGGGSDNLMMSNAKKRKRSSSKEDKIQKDSKKTI